MKRRYFLLILTGFLCLNGISQDPITYTVTKAIDVIYSDPEYEHTLRWAIERSNLDEVKSVIEFNIPNSVIPCKIPITIGTIEISREGLIIDGNSQPAPNYFGIEPKIELVSQLSDQSYCIKISPDNRDNINWCQSIQINNVSINSSSSGIYILAAREVIIDHCTFKNNSIRSIWILNSNEIKVLNNRIQKIAIENDDISSSANNNQIVNNSIEGNIFITGEVAQYNLFSKNLIVFPQCQPFDKPIEIDPGANFDYAAPIIQSLEGNIVSGTTEKADDIIEVFGANDPCSVNSYLGFCVSNANGNWSFTLPTNESSNYIVATATYGSDIYQNTSELSSPYPNISFEPLSNQYCETNPPILLSATPPGGVFIGPGVQGNYFYPALVDPSSPQLITITYRYYIDETQYHEKSQTTTVNPSEFDFENIPASCNPGGDGTITLDILEGSGSYTFFWSTQNGIIPPGQADDPTISPVPVGNYSVIFTDAGYGCTPQYRSYTLNNPVVTVEVEDLLICDNTTTLVHAHSSRNYHPVSPPSPYSYRYQWYRILPDQTTLMLEDQIDGEDSEYSLSAGNYKLVVTDQVYNCSDEIHFIVRALNTSVSIGSIRHISCSGANDGEATAFISGGVSPYVYKWYKRGPYGDNLINTGSSTVQNLSSGMYFVTVTNDNGNGCMVRSNLFSINEPAELKIFEPIEVMDCTAGISIDGGTANYTYRWYKLEATQWIQKGELIAEDKEIKIDNLGMGEYYISVNDNNDCGPVISYFRVGEINMIKSYNICFRFRGDLEQPEYNPPLLPEPVNSYVSDIVKTIGNRAEQCISQANANMAKSFTERCSKPGNINDNLYVTYTQNPYQYTLYYYDRVGNLVRTVPPEGVASDAESRADLPVHSMVTEYDYNSINQIIRQKTPDGGESRFIYDSKGQLRFSQNAKQAAITSGLVFSYTKYDELGRVLEVGESKHNGGITDFINLQTLANDVTYPLEESPSEDNSQQIWTIYNVPGPYYYYDKPQRFLDNRVSYTKTADQVFTYYSYDPHGNVEWLIQKLPGFRPTYIGYEYDLISNKVTMVKYNEFNNEDRLFHKYGYDEDNRLVKVETSKDGYLWETDGEYAYYPHGPLMSLGIGHDKLQKVDYSYTINGWLKGINKPSMLAHTENEDYPTDIYATSLQYFAKDNTDPLDHGDYVTNAASYNFQQDHAYNSDKRLYNGNIVSWSNKYDLTSLPPLTPFKFGANETGYAYKYDKLNRIISSDFKVLESSIWRNKSDYQSSFAYDANGNITQLSRNADETQGVYPMDNLIYNYNNTSNNQLSSVQENLATNGINGTLGDIKGTHNYEYDEIGNLISDEEMGNPDNIKSIQWNAYGKISKVFHADGSSLPDLEYIYDAAGNRVIKKKVYSNPASIVRDYYVRDAQGNIMAIYSNNYTQNANQQTFIVEEQPIYGSSRIGTISTGKQIVLGGSIESFPSSTYIRTLGQKNYELTDHLGNVRAVIKDYIGTQSLNAQVNSLVDYYAFGAIMLGRNYNSSNYRYGYNGCEKLNETYSEGDYVDLGARGLDTRLGRLNWSIDPRSAEYPWQSPYAYYGNSPIVQLDYNGEGDFYGRDGKFLGNDKQKDKKVYHVDGKDNFKIDDFREDGKYFNKFDQYAIDFGDGNSITQWNYSVSDPKLKEYLPILDKLEGGYSDVKGDKGGKTNYGITLASFKRYSMSLIGVEGTADNLERMTQEQASKIIEKGFWEPSKATSITSKKVGWAYFDTYFNGGGSAVLKSTLSGFNASGIKGMNTVLKTYSEKDILYLFNSERRCRYAAIILKDPSQKKFEDGWENRILKFERLTK